MPTAESSAVGMDGSVGARGQAAQRDGPRAGAALGLTHQSRHEPAFFACRGMSLYASRSGCVSESPIRMRKAHLRRELPRRDAPYVVSYLFFALGRAPASFSSCSQSALLKREAVSSADSGPAESVAHLGLVRAFTSAPRAMSSRKTSA